MQYWLEPQLVWSMQCVGLSGAGVRPGTGVGAGVVTVMATGVMERLASIVAVVALVGTIVEVTVTGPEVADVLVAVVVMHTIPQQVAGQLERNSSTSWYWPGQHMIAEVNGSI